VSDPTTIDMVLRLVAATAVGAALGLERELNAQPAGFRTHLLVSLGAALFTVAGTDIAGADPTRVAAQVVTGTLAVATVATAIALVALVVLKVLERDVFPQRRGRIVELRLDREGALPDVAGQARDVLGGKVQVERVAPGGDGGTLLVLRAQLPRGSQVIDLATRLRALPCVTDVDLTV
jgi:putative Mg2+ transporter-C (MgtC) family protein